MPADHHSHGEVPRPPKLPGASMEVSMEVMESSVEAAKLLRTHPLVEYGALLYWFHWKSFGEKLLRLPR